MAGQCTETKSKRGCLMGSFERNQETESLGLMDIIPYAENRGQIILTGKQMFLQKVVGDMIHAGKLGTHRIELKVEVRNRWGNLFLESFSNRKWMTRGWMDYSQADWLWWYFLEQRELYHMDFAELREWMFGGKGKEAHALKYPERLQSKHEQANDTWGWAVPIADLREALPSFKGPIDPVAAVANSLEFP